MKYKPTSPTQQKTHSPIVTGLEDLLPAENRRATFTLPPIAYVLAFIVLVAMMSLMASVMHG